MGSKAGVLKVAAKRLGMPLNEYGDLIRRGFKHYFCCRQWRTRSDFRKDASRGDGSSSKCCHCTRVKERKTTKGRPSPFKGRLHTETAKAKMSMARKGRPGPFAGQARPIETRLKISATLRQTAVRGSACPSYKDGKHAERLGERHSAAYKRWRFDVFSRDGFACVHCGDDRGGNLHAHHKEAFADNPVLRLSVDNGITLCEACHNLVHRYGVSLGYGYHH
jgi:NUMOD3 motif/HNH endonuclease